MNFSRTKKPKVGILTTLTSFDPAYSLVSVIRDQLVAHTHHGYKPVLFVLETFPETEPVPEGVEVRRVVPQLILEPYQGFECPRNWRSDVKRVIEMLDTNAKDIEIMLTHDLMFIDSYLPYNLGIRDCHLECRWYHWVHSAPSPQPNLTDNLHANRYIMPKKGYHKLVYLNNEQAQDLAEMYGTYTKDVRVVPNARDPRTFWNLHPMVEQLMNNSGIHLADFITVYPVSTTRMMDGKQLNAVIGIHEGLRKQGYTTKLIVANAHANQEKERRLCESLDSPHTIFTSLLMDGKYDQGVPGKVVSDLFRLANLFIFPSISENCSLVLLEAMLSNQLVVLNKDCPGFREFGGSHSLFFKFGNLYMGTRNTEHAVERQEYLDDIAKIIASESERCRPLLAKRYMLQNHNYDKMMNKIESMYYEYVTDTP